jgi:signal transduction histidine kinase
MSATITQFAALLNLLPDPARVYDVQGRVIAENHAARTVNWPDDNGGDGPRPVATVELGQGWYLRRISNSEHLSAPHTNAPLSPMARPNLQALLAGITHELRNPMAAILTAVSLLQDDDGLSEESAMLLGVVRKEARRMNQIMTEFSLYVKPPQPHPETFDLAELVREVITHLRKDGSLVERVTVRDQLPDGLQVHADKHQMQQALSRVIENSAEALETRDGAVLLLSGQADVETKRVLLAIEDNGDGLDLDDLQRAFLPFYSTKPHSTGLGLSTAQVAVQAAGGAIWLENIQNGEPSAAVCGARINLALPLAQNS